MVIRFCLWLTTLLTIPSCYGGHQDTADISTVYSERDGVSGSRCPNTASGSLSPEDTPEWVVKLKPVTKESYLGIKEQDRHLDQSELTDIAVSLAQDFGLENMGHVSPFLGVFKLRLGFHEGGMEKRDISRRLAEVDRSLDEHPKVLWASRQHCLVRHKRKVRMDFNDPMFSRQWHLVSSELCHVVMLL